MTASLTPLDRWRLNVVRLPKVFAAADIMGLLGRVKLRPEIAEYDVLFDYSAVAHFDLEGRKMVELAMKRRSLLPVAPGRPVRSAAVGARDTVRETVETWTAFFNERDRAVDVASFDTLEQALDWIGCPEALSDVRAALANV